MIEFQTSDFQIIEGFRLAWRWTDPKHTLLKPEVLNQLRPLNAAKAQQIAEEARMRCVPCHVADYDMAIQVDGDDPGPARERLETLGIDPQVLVILSWDATTALLTTWRIFREHWETFCYPSSDDVTIWAPGQGWTLCYRHFEAFHFASSNRAA